MEDRNNKALPRKRPARPKNKKTKLQKSHSKSMSIWK